MQSGVRSGYDYRYEYNYQSRYRPPPYGNCWRTTMSARYSHSLELPTLPTAVIASTSIAGGH